jgi:hypothetical protein
MERRRTSNDLHESDHPRDWGDIEHTDRPSRQSAGRRSDDTDPRLTISRKAVVITAILIDAFYLAGQAILFGNGCFQ